MVRWLVGAICSGLLATPALAAEPIEIGMGYLHHAAVRSTLSPVKQPTANDGVAGARLGIEDDNTTGKFLNQHFSLDEMRLNVRVVGVANSKRALVEHEGVDLESYKKGLGDADAMTIAALADQIVEPLIRCVL